MYGMNNRLGRVVLCLAVGFAAPALPRNSSPRAQGHVEQYVAYAKQVQDSLGETAEILKGMNLVAFRTCARGRSTSHDHTIRPSAWITRQMDEEGGSPRAPDRILAGSEAEFAVFATTRSGMCTQGSRAAISDVGCSFQRLRSLSYTSGLPHRLTPPPGIA
jgi:hypothetical protein